MRGDVMNVWNWIDNLARGLKKVATELQQSYQQILAYVDGHDKETLEKVNELIHDSIKLRSPNGTIYKIAIDDGGNIKIEKAGE